MASQEGHGAIVRKLLASSADVNPQTKSGYTALMAASQEGHAAIVKELLAKGADINLQAENGATALSAASRKGHTDIVIFLKNARAYPNK